MSEGQAGRKSLRERGRELIPKIWTQVRINAVAIISLVIAMSGAAYNTWRNENTEHNRNTRQAAFEMLKQLGEAQVVIEYVHFKKSMAMGDPLQGWGRVTYIRDLAQLLPSPAPAEADAFFAAWRDNVEALENDKEAMIRITDEMQKLKLTVIETLATLH